MGFRREFESKDAQNHRRRFLRRFGIRRDSLVVPQQTHGTGVGVVKNLRSKFPRTDALITDQAGVCLGIITSDCAPVFLYDSAKRAVGIVHAGWRGTVRGILTRAIRAMQREFGTQADDLEIVIGPRLCVRHHEIRSDVFPAFRHVWRHVKRKNKKHYADVAAILRAEAAGLGVKSSNIAVSSECTYHQPRRYFSYRRERSKKHPHGTGNMLSIIALRS